MEVVPDVADLDRWRLVGLLGSGARHDNNRQYEDNEQQSNFHFAGPFREVTGPRALTLNVAAVIGVIRLGIIRVFGKTLFPDTRIVPEVVFSVADSREVWPYLSGETNEMGSSSCRQRVTGSVTM